MPRLVVEVGEATAAQWLAIGPPKGVRIVDDGGANAFLHKTPDQRYANKWGWVSVWYAPGIKGMGVPRVSWLTYDMNGWPYPNLPAARSVVTLMSGTPRVEGFMDSKHTGPTGEYYLRTFQRIEDPSYAQVTELIQQLPELGRLWSISELPLAWPIGEQGLVTLQPPLSGGPQPIKRQRGGRLPLAMDAICGRCDRPRGDHGGRKKLGACPDESGTDAKRFQIKEEDR